MFANDPTAPERVRVKICGITTLADALAAIYSGADALGFNTFSGSKRYVNVHTEADWMASLPKNVTKVAVMVEPGWDELVAVASLPFIDSVQLHGRESPEFCRRVAGAGIRFAKALPVHEGETLQPVADFFTDTVLLDSSSRRGFGGTGMAFDWSAGKGFVEEHSNLNVIVAGGLTPENVAKAVREIRPFGVDVTTGVEASPGRKDPARVRDFIAAVRAQ